MFTPPKSWRKRAPAAYEKNDIAGIGEKPITRSGPHLRAVYRAAAEINSDTSSHLARRKPPLPRACRMRERFCGSSTSEPQASTGLACLLFASRQKSSSGPRTYGYFTLIGL